MARDRKSRETEEYQEIDLMEPVDITLFGTDDDPCFGKHYDLKADECQRCGDSEFCALKMGQTLNKERKQIESSTKFLDVDEEVNSTDETERVKKSVRRAIRKGTSLLKVKKLIGRKYPEFPKESVKEIYKSYKK